MVTEVWTLDLSVELIDVPMKTVLVFENDDSLIKRRYSDGLILQPKCFPGLLEFENCEAGCKLAVQELEEQRQCNYSFFELLNSDKETITSLSPEENSWKSSAKMCDALNLYDALMVLCNVSNAHITKRFC